MTAGMDKPENRCNCCDLTGNIQMTDATDATILRIERSGHVQSGAIQIDHSIIDPSACARIDRDRLRQNSRRRDEDRQKNWTRKRVQTASDFPALTHRHD